VSPRRYLTALGREFASVSVGLLLVIQIPLQILQWRLKTHLTRRRDCSRVVGKSSFRTPRRLSGQLLADALSRTANRVGFSVDASSLAGVSPCVNIDRANCESASTTKLCRTPVFSLKRDYLKNEAIR